MSYILDALRKAEAERERGRVPGVHAQPAFGGVAPGLPAGDRSAARWVVPLSGAIVVLVAVLVWALMRRGPAGVVAASSPPAASVTNTSPVAPAATTPTMPAPATPSPALARAPAPAPTPSPTPLPAPPVFAAPSVDASALAARRARSPAPTVATTNPPPAAAVRPGSTESADARVYAINDLPDDIRRQLPALSVGGSVYSAVPANRILFLNGQVLHEGDRLSPELALQQIRLKTAVMVFRGYRYELPF